MSANPSVPIILRAIMAVQLALQGIRAADGYHYDVKPSSVVLDPVALQTIPQSELPYFVVGLVEEGPRITSRTYQGAKYVKDVWTFPIVCRIDADGADSARKITAIANIISDIEQAVVQDLSLGNLIIDTRLEPSETPSFAFGGQNMVFVKQPVSVRLNPRLLGQMG